MGMNAIIPFPPWFLAIISCAATTALAMSTAVAVITKISLVCLFTRAKFFMPSANY